MKRGILAAALLVSTTVWAAPVLVNGSFDTEPNAAVTPGGGGWTNWTWEAAVPAPWELVSQSPDINDVNNFIGRPLDQVQIAPKFALTASPDGGSWVGFGVVNIPDQSGSPTPNIQESFGQAVSGFEPGKTYTLSWHAANFGLEETPEYRAYQSAWMAVYLDGTLLANLPALPAQQGWVPQSVQFTASASTHQIEFRAQGVLPALLEDALYVEYLHIDGVALREYVAPGKIAAVPVNGVIPLALLTLAVGGAALLRRRA